MTRREQPDLDLSKLYELSVDQPKMQKQASSHRVKFAESKSRFSKIAFDLFRDSESEFIWKLEKDSETGEEYIIRTASVDPQFKTSKNWSTQVDSGKSAITLVYKGHAIKAFKKAEVQFDDKNVDEWRRFLVDKISTDPSFLTKILAGFSDERKSYIFGKYPELKK